LQQDDTHFTRSCQGDLVVRLPAGATVQVGIVDGDASLKNLSGTLQVAEVKGDLSIREINTLELERVHSDLALRSARGDVHIGQVAGGAGPRRAQRSSDSVADDSAIRGLP
jgi:hypothetical protein